MQLLRSFTSCDAPQHAALQLRFTPCMVTPSLL